MPRQDSRVDADFYAMIHQRIVDAPEESPERRRDDRQEFSGMQWLAPWDGIDFPPETAFLEVRCHDLTCSGFSFFASQRPLFREFVIGFGEKPNLIYVAAEPIRFTDVLMLPSGKFARARDARNLVHGTASLEEIGRPMVLVGCRFLRRLKKPDTQ